MMICDSDNVVKCYNVYENRSLKIMVMEFCNGGELQREIINKYKIPEREAILILKQIINGIAVLVDLLRNCIITISSIAILKPKTFCRITGSTRSQIWAFPNKCHRITSSKLPWEPSPPWHLKS